MARSLVSEEDIRQLWDFFFDATDGHIREATKGIEIAVLGTEREILRHYNRPGREALFNTLELLRSRGQLVGGLGDGFNEAVDASFVDISFDTTGPNGLTVIPYNTQVERRNDPTVFAVFYGEKVTVFGGAVTRYFKLLAAEGCAGTREKLYTTYGMAVPECTPVPPVRRSR